MPNLIYYTLKNTIPYIDWVRIMAYSGLVMGFMVEPYSFLIFGDTNTIRCENLEKHS